MKLIKATAIIIFSTVIAISCSSINDGNLDETVINNDVTITAESNGKAKGEKDNDSTIVPGHQTDDDTIPVGTVNGKYKSIYAYDANGDWYWDLGDGRIQGTVAGIDDLDQSTLSVCDYEVIYRGDFNGDPFLDSGWIRNNIKCSGYDYENAQTYNSVYVHETDPRYSEDLEPIWGSWGIFVDVVGGTGNAANPKHPVNN